MYLFLVSSSSFQYLAQEVEDKMTFEFPLLSLRDHIEKDVHLQLNHPLPLFTFVHIGANPLPSQGADIFYG